MIVNLITTVYNFLWGDLFTIPLPGGGSLGISLLILLLIPTGIYFTIRTRFLPIRLFPDMIRALSEKKNEKSSLSSFQTLIVSTATRVGMGNLVGVVAAVSAGGAVFFHLPNTHPDSTAMPLREGAVPQNRRCRQKLRPGSSPPEARAGHRGRT